MSRQPIAKGRAVYVAEKYQSRELDGQGQPKEKNRYATLGRVTAWAPEPGQNMPNITLQLDAVPVGATGPVDIQLFWDEPQQQSTPQQNHQQPSYGQPASYGSYGTHSGGR